MRKRPSGTVAGAPCRTDDGLCGAARALRAFGT